MFFTFSNGKNHEILHLNCFVISLCMRCVRVPRCVSGAREQCWSLFSPSFIDPNHRTQVVWFIQQTYLLLSLNLSNPASCFYLFLRLCHIAQASLKLMVLIAKPELNPYPYRFLLFFKMALGGCL